MRAQIVFAVALVAILFAPAYAKCGDNAIGHALALQENEASTVKVYVDSQKGQGVLLNITSIFGETTQESIANAYFLAGKEAKGSLCQFTLTFENISDEINGPSAGLLLSLLFYGIENSEAEKIHYTATGAIGKNGDVYPIGGVYEKAHAAMRGGFDVFLYPDYIEDETVIIQGLFENVATRAIPVKKFKTAKDAVFNSEIPEFRISDYATKRAGADSSHNSGYFEKFAIEYVNLEEENAKALFGIYREYSEKNIEMQKEIMQNKFYYTVANDAFNKYATQKAYLVKISENEGRETALAYQSAKECLSEIEFGNEAFENIEMVAGAKVRYYRALEAIEAYEEMNKTGGGEKTFFESMNSIASLVKAKLWCESAKEMNFNSIEGLTLLNKEKLKNDAFAIEQKLLEKEFTAPPRMQKMLENNDYLPYLYEYAFLDTLEINETETGKREKYNSFWANVYASQAEYLEKTGHDSKELYAIAGNMESLFSRMNSQEYAEKIIIGGKQENQGEEKNACAECSCIAETEKCKAEKISMLLFFAVLIVLGIALWKSRKPLKKS